MTHTVKTLLFTLILSISFSTLADAPHYDRYERTPAVSFEGDILDFYSTKKPYGEFSNFGLFPITVDGKRWPTSEHYYQAHKYDTEEMQERVRATKSPYLAAKLGRDKRYPKRKDWLEVKDGIMFKALLAKFSEYDSLRELLLSTNDAEIFEHTKNDCYWGDCGDRTGKNKLGKQLMIIREMLVSGEL
jgi:ribA/ribD-fused uncharacterized protein